MIVEDTGRDDDPRSRCSLIGSDVGVYVFNNVYRGYSLGCYDPALVNPIL